MNLNELIQNLRDENIRDKTLSQMAQQTAIGVEKYVAGRSSTTAK
jgi:hypothetical protein